MAIKLINQELNINRIKYERLLLSLALSFIDVTPSKIDNEIENGLRIIASNVNADRCYIYVFNDAYKQLTLKHRFCQKEVKEKIPQHDRVDSEDFTWLIHPILNDSAVNIISPNELPKKANTIKVIMEVEETKSMFLCPIVFNQKVGGFIGLDSVQECGKFSDDIDFLLRKSGIIFAGAINRRDAVKSGIRIEQKIRTLFSGIGDVVYISTPEGKFVDINPAGAKLFGYDSVKDLLKVNIEKDLYVNPDDRKKNIKKLEMGGQVKDYELELKRKDGQKIIVLETATVERDENGKIIAYQGILRDVTDKRHLEQQLLQAQKMESIGLLAGGVAHDFNNILTTIGGYAELVRLDMNPNNPHYESISNIIKGVKRAEDLVRQLLAFGRRQMFEPKIIDINKVITELYSMLDRLITEDIHIDLELKDGISCITADPIQIQQILVNLVINADHAIKKQENQSNGKKITIITDEVTIKNGSKTQLAGSRPGKYVTIAVKDTGIGMDEETKQKIFEPFFSTKEKGKGTGLGLSTVYGIVKQNNSDIFIETALGKGSTFKIHWPITEKKIADETPMESRVDFKKHTETILFVEDDTYVRELMCNALKSFGYVIFEAENGKLALDLIKKDLIIDKIDLAILDIVMPEMSGEELAENLRQLNPEIKILLCSGFSDSRIHKQAIYDENRYFFLPKPYTLKKLEKTIRSILTNSR